MFQSFTIGADSSLKTFNFLFQFLKDSTYICQNKDINSMRFNKTQLNQFSWTVTSCDLHCFLLSKSLVKFNFNLIFFSKGSVLIHENSIILIYLPLKQDFINFPSFPSFHLTLYFRTKTWKRKKLSNLSKLWIFFVRFSKAVATC